MACKLEVNDRDNLCRWSKNTRKFVIWVDITRPNLSQEVKIGGLGLVKAVMNK